MKKFPNICLLSLLALGSSQAAVYTFDNSDGDRLFSGANNWNYVSGTPEGTFPVNNDTLRVDNTQFTTTLLAPALIDSAWSLTGGNTFFQGFGTAYGLVQNGANLRPAGVSIGAAATATNHGFVTVATGGQISSSAAANGSLIIGGSSTQSNGTLLLQAGAIVNDLPNLNLGSTGILQFTANTTGFGGTSMALKGSNTWAMNGRLTLDLSAYTLTTPTQFTLIDQINATPVSMTGALRTWLDGGTGSSRTVTGSGSFGGGVFEIIGLSGSGSTTLSYNDTSKTLFVTTAIPEPAGYASWAAINAPTGTVGDDFDGDGVSNGVEYVLGGDKNTDDLSKLPQVTATGGNLLFTFFRARGSVDGTTTVAIEVGTTLANWPVSFSVPDAAATNNPGVTVTENSPDGFDTVTLSIPQAPDAKKFARLKVTVP